MKDVSCASIMNESLVLLLCLLCVVVFIMNACDCGISRGSDVRRVVVRGRTCPGWARHWPHSTMETRPALARLVIVLFVCSTDALRLLPIGPFCPFRSKVCRDGSPLDESMSALTQVKMPKFATEMQRLQLEAAANPEGTPDVARIRRLATDLVEAEAQVRHQPEVDSRARADTKFVTRGSLASGGKCSCACRS